MFLIQVSNDENFDSTDASTLTLYDGVIDIDPNSTGTATATGYVGNVIGHTMPDGYNLFLLDLSTKLQSESYRYLRVYMTPTLSEDEEDQNSTALSVAVNNLRVYHGG